MALLMHHEFADLHVHDVVIRSLGDNSTAATINGAKPASMPVAWRGKASIQPNLRTSGGEFGGQVRVDRTHIVVLPYNAIACLEMRSKKYILEQGCDTYEVVDAVDLAGQGDMWEVALLEANWRNKR